MDGKGGRALMSSAGPWLAAGCQAASMKFNRRMRLDFLSLFVARDGRGRGSSAAGGLPCRALGVAALFACLALAGCVGPSSPPVPGDSERAWDATAEPWLVRTTGCGLCGPATGQPVHELMAYDQGGGVLIARYARAESGTGAAVADPALAGYQSTLSALFGAVSAYAVEDGRGVVVHEVQVARLSAADESSVDRFLEMALRNAIEPGPPDFTGCADCPAVTLDALSGQRRLSVVLNMVQGHEDDAWRRIDDQFLTLSRWVHGELDDPRAGTGGPAPAESAQEAVATPWLVRSTGCGHCSGDPDTAEFDLLLVDYGGAMVAVSYGRDTSFSVVPGVDVDESALRGLFQRVEAYGEGAPASDGSGSGPGVRVHEVRFGAMPAVEFDRIRSDLEATIASAADPGPPDTSDCVDCAAVHIETYDGDVLEWRVQLLGNTNKGDPWLAIDRSLRGLGDWLADRP